MQPHPTLYTITIPETLHLQRLDKALATLLPELSRTRIQQLIAGGHVLQQRNAGDAVVTDAAAPAYSGSIFVLHVPPAQESTMLAQEMPLDIRYEDDCLLVLNKPAGLTVHPGAGTPDGTLANALLAHCGDSLSGIGGVARPGIVHRIDKDTTGLLMVAKTDAAHQHLSAQLAARSLSRTYTAFVWGAPNPPAGSIEAAIDRSPRNRQKMAVVKDGRSALTHYITEQRFVADDGFIVASMLSCKLATGRTHQIRVHMAHIKHPLIGDQTYGKATHGLPKCLPDETKTLLREFPRQALHASRLEFIHPTTEQLMTIEAELPEDMQQLYAVIMGDF